MICLCFISVILLTILFLNSEVIYTKNVGVNKPYIKLPCGKHDSILFHKPPPMLVPKPVLKQPLKLTSKNYLKPAPENYSNLHCLLTS